MKEYAEEENVVVQHRRMLISNFHSADRQLRTPSFLFDLGLGLVCKEIHRFVQYFPRNCLNTFVLSAVKARPAGVQFSKSSAVAENMELLANSLYGYQVLDSSRHTETKYLNDEKTHSAKNSERSKLLNYITDQLYEVAPVKPKVEHRKSIHVGLFILKYAKQIMFKLYYSFLEKNCDADKIEELERDTHSLFGSIRRKLRRRCSIQRTRPVEWKCIQQIAQTLSLPTQLTTSFPECAATHTSNMMKRNQGSLRKSLDLQKIRVFAVKRTVAVLKKMIGTNSTAKVWTNGLLKTVVMDQFQCIAKCWMNLSFWLQH